MIEWDKVEAMRQLNVITNIATRALENDNLTLASTALSLLDSKTNAIITLLVAESVERLNGDVDAFVAQLVDATETLEREVQRMLGF
jgi:hypothetical protein